MITEIISGICVFAFLMLLHYTGLWIGRVQDRRRKAKHYEIVGHLPSGSAILLPEGYKIDADGIIVSKKG